MAFISPIEYFGKTGQKVIIRTPSLVDGDKLLKYVGEVLKEGEFFLTAPDEITLTAEQESDWIEKLRKSQSSIAFIAEFESNIIGMLHFSTGHRRRIAHAGEFGMSLLKNFRNDGLGSMMLKTLLAWATQTPGIEKVSLQVHATNSRAIELYKSLGFQQEGVLKNNLKYEDGHYVDTIVMAKFVKESGAH